MAASVPTVVRPCRRYNQLICYPEAKGAGGAGGRRDSDLCWNIQEHTLYCPHHLADSPDFELSRRECAEVSWHRTLRYAHINAGRVQTGLRYSSDSASSRAAMSSNLVRGPNRVRVSVALTPVYARLLVL